ncbi:MAG: GDSL-type esterase/lipase family protein [Henriciella sp.]|nr:GDSL-type esterase/lipase family protein [Henriciella sp.]
MPQNTKTALARLTASILGLICLSACAATDAVAQEAAIVATPERAAPVSTEPIAFGPQAPFASEIYNFFVQDELFGPATCQTVFIGSSSIRFWLTLEEDFPALAPLNRGFGGSEITHVIGYFDVLLARHTPQEIVFYAGENDLNAGATPAEVAARFETFMELKSQRLGDTPVYFLSIKPSFARLSELGAQAEANALIAALAQSREDLTYVDIAAPMLEDGVPKPIFISDQLHMNLDGYAIWTDVLSAALSAPDRPRAAGCETE